MYLLFRTEHELKEYIAATILKFFEEKLKCTHRMLKIRTNQYHITMKFFFRYYEIF